MPAIAVSRNVDIGLEMTSFREFRGGLRPESRCRGKETIDISFSNRALKREK